ncbi:acyl-CoA dehydrogenase family protein [Clostridiisalibacter paucivorans]|uniref:acyl-CoA dehydrogenase family protein n=1 Tax=Clostridiisalibacter paucivorans TaxID=408753 RepID=UPI0004787282|nr:acyl-CoA dehydrogenase family protein [Clostridiisalibacter paucivorans]
MDFNLSSEQQMVVNSVKELAENKIKPFAMELEEKGEFNMDAFKDMAKMGLFALPFDEKVNGAKDYLSYILSVEEISKVCGSTGIAYSVQVSLCAGGIDKFGSEEQKEKYLKPLASGEKIGAFCLTEPNAGTDASGVETVAEKRGDKYVLNGKKCFITNGPLADVYLVFAKTDKDAGTRGISAFIVDRESEGLSIGKIENKMGIRSAQVSEIIFEDCEVSAENLVLDEGKGFRIAMAVLDGGRIGVAAQGLGIAEGAFDEVIKYMKERKQFGKPISSFQGLQWIIADMDAKIEQARYLVYKAAMDKQEGKPYSVSAARAKLVATDAAMYVTTNAVQLMGGYGFMKDYPVERMMRDAKITQIYEGTNQVQKMIISGNAFR